MTRRMEKVNDLLQSEVADLILRRVKHPVLQEAMLTITRGEVVVVPPNVGPEVGDVIELTGAASGLAVGRGSW